MRLVNDCRESNWQKRLQAQSEAQRRGSIRKRFLQQVLEPFARDCLPVAKAIQPIDGTFVVDFSATVSWELSANSR